MVKAAIINIFILTMDRITLCMLKMLLAVMKAQRINSVHTELDKS